MDSVIKIMHCKIKTTIRLKPDPTILESKDRPDSTIKPIKTINIGMCTGKAPFPLEYSTHKINNRTEL